MLSIIPGTLQQFRSRLVQKVRNAFNLVGNIFLLYNHKAGKGKRTVYFDLREGRLVPYYFILIYAFIEAGDRVVLRLNGKFISGIYGLNKQLLHASNCTCSLKFPKGKLFGFHDRRTGCHPNALLYLDPTALLKRVPTGIRLSVSMHPSMYVNKYHVHCRQFRNTGKRFRVLFSGNTDRIAYDKEHIFQKYHMPNRYEALKAITQDFNKDHVVMVSSIAQWKDLTKEGYLNKVVVLKWAWSSLQQHQLALRIPAEQWLPTLAKAHFFLALPGVVTPQSHNLVEAMSVGCIPIMSYKDFLSPALVHLKNCIYYKDSADLLVQLQKVLAYSEAEIVAMSQEVALYYDQHLSPSGIVRQLERAGKDSTVYFYNEVYC